MSELVTGLAPRIRPCEWHLETARVRLREEQGDRCAICGVRFRATNPACLDHDHNCPACSDDGPGCEDCVRGLLCGPCNLGLGTFRDDPDRLLAAAQYVNERNVQDEEYDE